MHKKTAQFSQTEATGHSMYLKSIALLLTALFAMAFAGEAAAHGERAQQANLRMRSINWYDMKFSSTSVEVGQLLTITGRIQASKYWPEHLPSVAGRVFLNVGTAGPNFIRVKSSINGQSMVQSTSLELGKTYDFEMVLKARRPGRFHVHPVMNVLDSGGMIGPGLWVTVTGDQADFTNTVETMFGRTIDLETYNLGTIITWHAIWVLVALAWIAFWARKRPLIIPRFRAVQALEEAGKDPDELITPTERNVAIGFLVATLVLVGIGYQWAQAEYPVTTPLRTAKVNVEPLDLGKPLVDVKLDQARYRIPGRSFQMDLTVTNHSRSPIRLAEFDIANIRFLNPEVIEGKPLDDHDMVVPAGLRVEGGAIAPGKTGILKVYAEDAMWETQRLTNMINDPDSIVAGLLFFHAEDGQRDIVEIGGPMLPIFE